jgi:pyrroloquinoline quinone biosynthesis protein D
MYELRRTDSASSRLFNHATGAEVLELCDGERSLDEIVGVLAARYGGSDLSDDVRGLIDAMAQKGLVVDAAA